MSNLVIISVEFFAYLGSMIGIGAYCAREERSSSDFHLVGAVAAMMSTDSSQLLVKTSAISENVYREAINKDLTYAKLVTLSRISMFVVGLLRLIMSFNAKTASFISSFAVIFSIFVPKKPLEELNSTEQHS